MFRGLVDWQIKTTVAFLLDQPSGLRFTAPFIQQAAGHHEYGMHIANVSAKLREKQTMLRLNHRILREKNVAVDRKEGGSGG